ncbi:MAG: hypothetical protein LUQ65_02840 [Candidatus Helarchaeota archaeon]|nr:hypothetical protein [Candidatus Helarchaeota archaeon]
MENYAIMPSLKAIGFKKRNFGGFFPGKRNFFGVKLVDRGPIPYFVTMGLRLRHNLGFFSFPISCLVTRITIWPSFMFKDAS